MRDQPTSNREAELNTPTRIGSGDLLGIRSTTNKSKNMKYEMLPIIIGVIGIFTNSWICWSNHKYNSDPKHIFKMDSSLAIGYGFPMCLLGIGFGIIAMWH